MTGMVVVCERDRMSYVRRCNTSRDDDHFQKRDICPIWTLVGLDHGHNPDLGLLCLEAVTEPSHHELLEAAHALDLAESLTLFVLQSAPGLGGSAGTRPNVTIFGRSEGWGAPLPDSRSPAWPPLSSFSGVPISPFRLNERQQQVKRRG